MRGPSSTRSPTSTAPPTSSSPTPGRTQRRLQSWDQTCEKCEEWPAVRHPHRWFRGCWCTLVGIARCWTDESRLCILYSDPDTLYLCVPNRNPAEESPRATGTAEQAGASGERCGHYPVSTHCGGIQRLWRRLWAGGKRVVWLSAWLNFELCWIFSTKARKVNDSLWLHLVDVIHHPSVARRTFTFFIRMGCHLFLLRKFGHSLYILPTNCN